MGKVTPPPHTHTHTHTHNLQRCQPVPFRFLFPLIREGRGEMSTLSDILVFFSLHHHSCRHWECMWLKRHSHHCRPNVRFCQQERPWASAGSESDISRRGCKQRRHPCGVHLHRECVAWEQRQVLCETNDYKKSLCSISVACEKLVKEFRTVLAHWS